MPTVTNMRNKYWNTTVEVNGVQFKLMKRSDCEELKRLWDDGHDHYRPISGTPLGWITDMDQYLDKVIRAAGYDKEYDTALPMSYLREHSERPNAVWYYDKQFGRPLMLSEVYQHLDIYLRNAIWDLFFDLISQQ